MALTDTYAKSRPTQKNAPNPEILIKIPQKTPQIPAFLRRNLRLIYLCVFRDGSVFISQQIPSGIRLCPKNASIFTFFASKICAKSRKRPKNLRKIGDFSGFKENWGVFIYHSGEIGSQKVQFVFYIFIFFFIFFFYSFSPIYLALSKIFSFFHFFTTYIKNKYYLSIIIIKNPQNIKNSKKSRKKSPKNKIFVAKF